MKQWFVLFVRSGSEIAIAEYLRGKLNADKYLPFVLTKETLFWSHGEPTIDRKPLFNSYVMVETEMDIETVTTDMSPWIHMTDGRIYKLLSYGGDKNDIMLRESEQKAIESLIDSDFCVTASDGEMEGKKLNITSGALTGQENRIKKVLRNKQKAVLDVEFAGNIIETTVVLRLKKSA